MRLTGILDAVVEHLEKDGYSLEFTTRGAVFIKLEKQE